MKKVCTIIVSLTILMSLCACRNSDASDAAPNTIGTIGGIADGIEPVKPVDAQVGAKIDFEIPDMDISLEVEKIDPVTVNPIDFTIPAFELEFDVNPVKVSNDLVAFEFADYDFTIDVDSFDVAKFAIDSSGNFDDETKAEIANLAPQAAIILAETRANLLSDLSHAFKTSGLDVVVNEELGEIMLDSSVLFALNESEISPDGKLFLQKFLTVYNTIVFNEKYDGFISRMLVEGHTDSSGEYDYNLTLSQKRADNVKAFCLSEESGAGEYRTQLENSLEAIGYSYDKLIYDNNGNEDSNASRRVSFRFLIALPD